MVAGARRHGVDRCAQVLGGRGADVPGHGFERRPVEVVDLDGVLAHHAPGLVGGDLQNVLRNANLVTDGMSASWGWTKVPSRWG